jgi:YHS domain-containing protein
MEQQKFYKKKIFKMIIAIVVVIVVLVFTFMKAKHISPISLGRHNKVNQNIFSDLAINGFDPVAYFAQDKQAAGTETITHKWNGATWRFSSEENKNLFVANPEKYAPQFGGYCSFAVSKGFTANTDPKAWTIMDDKLYLFSDENFKAKWLAAPDENLKKCNEVWK